MAAKPGAPKSGVLPDSGIHANPNSSRSGSSHWSDSCSAVACKAGQQTGGGESPKGRLAALFERRAQPLTRGDLQKAYEKAKDPARKPDEREPTPEDPDKLEQAREKKDDLEKRQRGPHKDRDDRGPDRDK